MSLLCLFAHLCCEVWQKSKWNRWDSLIAVITKIRFIVKTVNIVQLQEKHTITNKEIEIKVSDG